MTTFARRQQSRGGFHRDRLYNSSFFAIYLSGAKQKVEWCMVTLFADDCRWLLVVDLVAQLCKRLERSGIKAVQWRKQNHVTFNNSKHEMLAFTRRQKPDLTRKQADVKIMLRDHTIAFNTETTR